MKKKLQTTAALIACLFSLTKAQTNYYVDYNAGNNANNGTSPVTAWKNSPCDPAGNGIPFTKVLVPGDTVFFKGGVIYQGQVKVNYSGSKPRPIVFCGDKWPGLHGTKAIIDGAQLHTGWAPVSPGDSIYVSNLPPGYYINPDSAAIGLWQHNSNLNTDDPLYASQTPNPVDFFIYDDQNQFYSVPTTSVTQTSIRSTSIFNQTLANHWQGSSIIFWGNPNAIYYRKIRSFNPATNTITFDALGATTIYTANPTQRFAIYNSKHALDKKGEYYLDPIAQKIYLYPRDTTNINSTIYIVKRGYGIDIQDKSNLSMEGFIVQRQGEVSSFSPREALGIGNWNTVFATRKRNIIIRNNHFQKLYHSDAGNGGISVTNTDTLLIENNTFTRLYQTPGVYCSGNSKTIVRNNSFMKPGSTCIRFYQTKNSQITHNTLDSVLNRHANGITTYLGCKNVLIASNKLTNCITPITFQDGGDLYYINNFVDARYGASNVHEWGRTSNPNPNVHTGGAIVFVNNTFVRNQNNDALSIGDCPYPSTYTQGTLTVVAPSNTYIAKNNIMDGGTCQFTVSTGPYYVRDHNVYLGKAWCQKPANSWFMSSHDQFDTDSSKYFFNAASLNFSLKPNSLAIDSGASVLSYIPTSLFPEYDFTKDLAGNPRSAIWDIGAYEFNSSATQIIKTNKEMPGLNSYPTPFTDEINITSSDLQKGSTIYLFNLMGQLVLKELVTENTEMFKIATPSNLQNGLYILKVEFGNGRSASRKILKQ